MEGGSSIIQSQNQTLLLTSQMHQSLKVLQCGTEELQEIITGELLENPALESLEIDQDSSDDSQSQESPKKEEDVQFNFSDEFQDDTSYANSSSRSEDEPSFEEYVANGEESLAEHLMSQIVELDLTEQERAIASYLIWNLNDDGYLSMSLEEAAQRLSVFPSKLEDALKVVQTLEPAGVAARDLAECLTIQLARQGIEDSLYARLLTVHAKRLTDNNLREIAFREDRSLGEIKEALLILRQLNPFPGRSFIDERPRYLTPDVRVEKVAGEYVVTLNNSGLPRLRINRSYQELVRSKGELNTKEKQFLRGKIRTASWLIRCIYQREQTLMRVATAILNRQKDFFDQGIEALKPLSLREIGEELDLHESTISRASANKVMETPRGLFEFKYFFSSGVKNQTGEASASAIKERIKTIIREEDVRRPKSDQQITKLLHEFDIVVARRTVTKYREALGIESASTRKAQYHMANTGFMPVRQELSCAYC